MSYEGGKTPISVIEEFCNMMKLAKPRIEYLCDGAGKYYIEMKISDFLAVGYGRTKREAKQAAAKHAIEMLRERYPTIDEISVAISKRDQQTSFNEASYTTTKKDTVGDFDSESKQKEILKAYEQMFQPKREEKDMSYIFNRHDQFTHYPDDLKLAAMDILNTPYTSHEAQAMDVMRALQLKPKISTQPTLTGEPLLLVDVDIERGVMFCNTPKAVFKYIIKYFRGMLR